MEAATSATNTTDHRKSPSASAKESELVIMQLPSVRMVSEDVIFDEPVQELDGEGLPKCWVRVQSPFVKRMKKLQRQKSALRSDSNEQDSRDRETVRMCLQPQRVAPTQAEVEDKSEGAARPASAVRVAGIGTVKPAVRKFPARGFYSLDSSHRPIVKGNNNNNNNRPVRVAVPAEFWDEFTQDFRYQRKPKPKPAVPTLGTDLDDQSQPASARRVQFSRPTSGRAPSQRNLIDDFAPTQNSRPISAASHVNVSARATSARNPIMANLPASFNTTKLSRYPTTYLDTVENKFTSIYKNSGATSHNNDLVLVVPPAPASPDHPYNSSAPSRVPVATYRDSDSRPNSVRHSFVHVPLSRDERTDVNTLLQSSFLRHIRPLTVHRRPKSALKQDIGYFAFWRGNLPSEDDYYYQ